MSDIFDCIDAGSENCPCFLALTGDCLTCNMLSGKQSCDCDWKGVCIYNEFTQNGKKIKNPRMDFNAPVLEKKRYMDDLMVFLLEVEKGFALKAGRPGAYVFVKARSDTSFYNVPISVMKSDAENGILHLAIKSISAKTKLLFREDKELTLRGVYRNGILNMRAGQNGMGYAGKLLGITKGIGFAPFVLLAEWLGKASRPDALIDTDKIGHELVLDYMPQNVNSVKEINLKNLFENEKEYEKLRQDIETKRYGAVAALTSDYYAEKIKNMTHEIKPSPRFACGNNFRLCCGEGICGACGITDATGKTFKMCKCNNLGR